MNRKDYNINDLQKNILEIVDRVSKLCEKHNIE